MVFALAALIAATGAGLYTFPAPRFEIAPFATQAAIQIGESDAVSSDVPPASSPPEAAGQDLQTLTSAFDLSTLPAPPPPVVPPPDPAAELKLYRYAGSAAAGERQKALFDGNGAIQSLSVGDFLVGFRLIRIERDAAIFSNEQIEVALPLGAPH